MSITRLRRVAMRKILISTMALGLLVTAGAAQAQVAGDVTGAVRGEAGPVAGGVRGSAEGATPGVGDTVDRTVDGARTTTERTVDSARDSADATTDEAKERADQARQTAEDATDTHAEADVGAHVSTDTGAPSAEAGAQTSGHADTHD
jgi:hypothetical protein